MDSCRIEMLQGGRHLDGDNAVGGHRTGYLIGRLKGFDRIDAVVRLLALFLLLLLLLPLLEGFLLLLQPLGIGCLGYHLKGIGLAHQPSGAVGHKILHRERERIGIDQSGIAEPVDEGVLLL